MHVELFFLVKLALRGTCFLLRAAIGHMVGPLMQESDQVLHGKEHRSGEGISTSNGVRQEDQNPVLFGL
jgi:hypothetical protein